MGDENKFHEAFVRVFCSIKKIEHIEEQVEAKRKSKTQCQDKVEMPAPEEPDAEVDESLVNELERIRLTQELEKLEAESLHWAEESLHLKAQMAEKVRESNSLKVELASLKAPGRHLWKKCLHEEKLELLEDFKVFTNDTQHFTNVFPTLRQELQEAKLAQMIHLSTLDQQKSELELQLRDLLKSEEALAGENSLTESELQIARENARKIDKQKDDIYSEIGVSNLDATEKEMNEVVIELKELVQSYNNLQVKYEDLQNERPKF